MKKMASLILVSALFYNVLGLYILFAKHQEQIWVNNMQKINGLNFEVLEFETNAYAYVVDSGFENVNEEIIINNKSYHVFRKRIQNNILKLYCLRNANSTISINLKKIVDEQLFDEGSNEENPVKKLIKSLIKDFIPKNINDFSVTTLFLSPHSLLSYHPQGLLLSGHFMLNYLPPDMV